MNVTKFRSFVQIQGQKGNFNRKKGQFKIKGVYFWGFTLEKNAQLPTKKNEIIIYYIGRADNIGERIMQHIASLFGGFYTIIDPQWLKGNPFTARITDLQESDSKPPFQLRKEVLHKSSDFKKLYNFYYDRNIQNAIKWMRDRFIFAWIEDPDTNSFNIKSVESELHHIVRTNIGGLQHIKNLTPKKNTNKNNETPLFHSINWIPNRCLKDWIIEVNNNIP